MAAKKNQDRKKNRPAGKATAGGASGKKQLILAASLLGALLVAAALSLLVWCKGEDGKGEMETAAPAVIDSALADAVRGHFDALWAMNPRYPGAPGHDEALRYQVGAFRRAGLLTRVQTGEFEKDDVRYPVENVIGVLCPECAGRLVLGAHYDIRRFADSDPVLENRMQPLPGANDGTSGTAILLALADRLEQEGLADRLVKANLGLDLVLFDAEEGPKGEDDLYCLGSKLYVQKLSLDERLAIRGAVIIDLVGDKDLHIPPEAYSTIKYPDLAVEIWGLGRDLGFLESREGPNMIDDHRPFIDAGVPTCLLIDFDYPPWHTLGDTPDKVSFENMAKVLTLLERWLKLRAGG